MMRLHHAHLLISLALVAVSANTAAAQAVSGFVREDSSGRPVLGAEVAIEALSRRTITDAAGKYVIADLPSGTRLVVVRRLGYGAVSALVAIKPGETAPADFRLERVPAQLDTMRVKEQARRPRGIGVEAFDERKLHGFGVFLDSAMLRKNEHRNMADLFRAYSSIKVITPPLCRPIGERTENCIRGSSSRVALGAGIGFCGMQVLLDGAPLSRGGPIDNSASGRGDPAHNWEAAFDLTSISLGSLTAIEVYPRASEVPMEYRDVGTECGLVLLWTRRR